MTYPWSSAPARARLHPGRTAAAPGRRGSLRRSPASGNGAWLDHLFAARRPVAFLGLKERSFEARYDPARSRAGRVPQGPGAGATRARRPTLAVVARSDFSLSIGAVRSVDFRGLRARAGGKFRAPRPVRRARCAPRRRFMPLRPNSEPRIPRAARRARTLARGSGRGRRPQECRTRPPRPRIPACAPPGGDRLGRGRARPAPRDPRGRACGPPRRRGAVACSAWLRRGQSAGTRGAVRAKIAGLMRLAPPISGLEDVSLPRPAPGLLPRSSRSALLAASALGFAPAAGRACASVTPPALPGPGRRAHHDLQLGFGGNGG